MTHAARAAARADAASAARRECGALAQMRSRIWAVGKPDGPLAAMAPRPRSGGTPPGDRDARHQPGRERRTAVRDDSVAQRLRPVNPFAVAPAGAMG